MKREEAMRHEQAIDKAAAELNAAISAATREGMLVDVEVFELLRIDREGLSKMVNVTTMVRPSQLAV